MRGFNKKKNNSIFITNLLSEKELNFIIIRPRAGAVLKRPINFICLRIIVPSCNLPRWVFTSLPLMWLFLFSKQRRHILDSSIYNCLLDSSWSGTAKSRCHRTDSTGSKRCTCYNFQCSIQRRWRRRELDLFGRHRRRNHTGKILLLSSGVGFISS